MKIYITVHRDSGNGSYQVYSFDPNKKVAYEKFKRDIKSFLSYGPDDLQNLGFYETDLNETELNKLKEFVDKYNKDIIDGYNKEFVDFLDDVLNRKESVELTFETCEGNEEIVNLFVEDTKKELVKQKKKFDEDDLEDDCAQKLWEDDELYNKYLEIYIEKNY